MKTNPPTKKPRVTYPPIEPGQRYGDLTIVKSAGYNNRNSKIWFCKCDCGTVWPVGALEIKRKLTQRCRPCGNKKATETRASRPRRTMDIAGLKWGMLTAESFAKKVGGHVFWTFQCDCGRSKDLRADSVKRGDVCSCGCKRNYNMVARKPASKPERPAGPKVARVKDTESTYSKHTPNYSYLSRPVAPTSTGDKKTALIIAAKKSGARWSEIADLVGLTVDECKSRCTQHAA